MEPVDEAPTYETMMAELHFPPGTLDWLDEQAREAGATKAQIISGCVMAVRDIVPDNSPSRSPHLKIVR